MTDKQYASLEWELLGCLQTMRENESGARLVIPQESSSGGNVDTLDDEYDQHILSEHQAALKEWIQYQRLVRKVFPKEVQEGRVAGNW
jgi:hypothetical protein